MGKRRYNAKAREVTKTHIDDTKTNEIKLEFTINEYGNTDTSNLLALPSQKRQTKVVTEKKEKTRFLSKAHRKRLEKILDKKKKKENRASLLESLSKVQATAEEVKQMTSISVVQTVGLRKLAKLDFINQNLPSVADSNELDGDNNKRKFNSIKGAYKRRCLLNKDSKEKKPKYDSKVVGLNSESLYGSSSDSESQSENEVDGTNEESMKRDMTIEHKHDESKETTFEESIKNDEHKHNESKETQIESCNETKDERIIEIDDESKSNNDIVNVADDKSKCNNDIVNVAGKAKKEPTENIKKIRLQNVIVNRDPKIQVARLKLPILGEEQKIMELISENDILIVAGETGSGKTTQLPQFLYEAGYAGRRMIGVTEPRRVAAVAMSERVAHELCLTSREVSYLMRFEGNATKDTKIKFMTDGVLLKEAKNDFLMSKYSVIIIDEAHERSVYTDILLGLLSRAVPRRRRLGVPLKLIVMSATLRVEDFTSNTRLFRTPPPVINIESRQFPVTVHFNKHTYSDYLKEAFRKTVKIHTRLPEGGILIFVTGQQEINYLVRKLKSAFPYRSDVDYSKLIQKKRGVSEEEAALDSEPDDLASDDDEVEREMKRAKKARRKLKKKVKELPKINLADYAMPEDDGQAELMEHEDSDGHLSDSGDEEELLMPAIKACRQPLWVLPLYSMLSTAKQARVFAAPPAGARLCVVSTDVAETSLTIPSIRYVVDTGKKKMRVYEQTTGASAWRVVWASQASGAQRAGRAGRTAPGHAYRLYSSAVYQHDMPPHHAPDLCARPVDDLLLQMKAMGIDKVLNFPFPTPPDIANLRAAERRLEVLGLLEKHVHKNEKKRVNEEIMIATPIGEAVSSYPILPRYGKMLALSNQANLLPYVITLVSALSVPEVMTSNADGWPATGHMHLLGDPGTLLRAVGAAEYAHLRGEEELFCAKHGLRLNAVREIRKLRKQLTREINLRIEGASAVVDPEMAPPTDDQAKLMRQILLCGLGDQVARKIGLDEVKQGQDKRKFKYAYTCAGLEEPVHLHSDSALRRTIPEWVVYQELYETGGEGRRKMVMRNVTAVEPEWLPAYVPALCNMGDPLSEPEPRYDEKTGRVRCHFNSTFGARCWELPTVEIDFPDKIERYRWFAKFVLEGSVFPKLAKFRSSLLSPPSTMVKSWATLQPRTEHLLKALVAKRAGSRSEMQKVWEQEPKYMLDAYLKWLPVSAHNDAMLLWPPL